MLNMSIIIIEIRVNMIRNGEFPFCCLCDRTCGIAGWPQHGEIDIIEYVNTDRIDTTTLHTDGGCDQSGEDINSFTGECCL